jgi:hypothetical protein
MNQVIKQISQLAWDFNNLKKDHDLLKNENIKADKEE